MSMRNGEVSDEGEGGCDGEGFDGLVGFDIGRIGVLICLYDI